MDLATGRAREEAKGDVEGRTCDRDAEQLSGRARAIFLSLLCRARRSVLFYRARDLELEALPGLVSFVAGRGVRFPRDVDVAYFETRADGYFRAGVFIFGGGDFFGECSGVIIWNFVADRESEFGDSIWMVAELYRAGFAKD